MAHYVWNEGTLLGRKLRDSLEGLRSARHDLADVLGAMNQMSNTQITAAFGFLDDTTSGNAKAELSSDVSNLNSGSPGAAIQQMLDQFA